MKASRYSVALVNAPNRKVARRLANGALEKHLVACANLIPGIESHYWWNRKIETGKEIMILFKTTQTKLAALEKFILANHPYDTPEFVVLTLAAGNSRYLAWLKTSTQS